MLPGTDLASDTSVQMFKLEKLQLEIKSEKAYKSSDNGHLQLKHFFRRRMKSLKAIVFDSFGALFMNSAHTQCEHLLDIIQWMFSSRTSSAP